MEPAPPSVPPAEVPRGPVTVVRHLAIGFLMGCADVVPGVSGGTVALVCGIYARLIDAIRDGARGLASLARGRVGTGVAEVRQVDWALLVPLLAGIGVAVFSLASVLEHLLEEQPVRLGALFLGLVAGTVVVAWQLLRHPDRTTAVLMIVSAIILFVALGLRSETTAEAGEVASAALWTYPAAGAVAICAMILPGVSGSFLLVALGMYSHVLGAVNERDFLVLGLFIVGCIFGLAVFSRILGWLLDHHHDRVVAVLIGLMLGSVRVLWPWPGGTETTELAMPSGDVALPVLLAVVGFVVVVGIGRVGSIREEPAPNPG